MSKNTKSEKKNLIINNKTEKIDTFNFSKDKIAFFQNPQARARGMLATTL